MTIRVASAPVSFGVFELTAGRDRSPGGLGAREDDGRARLRRQRARPSRLLRGRGRGGRDARCGGPRADGLVPAAALLAPRAHRAGHARAGRDAHVARRGPRRRREAGRAVVGRLLRARPDGPRGPHRAAPGDVARRRALRVPARERPPCRAALPRSRLPRVVPLPRGHVRRVAARDRALHRRSRPRRCSGSSSTPGTPRSVAATRSSCCARTAIS